MPCNAELSLTGDLDAGGNRITNLAAPVNPSDAVTKEYVDMLNTVPPLGPQHFSGSGNGTEQTVVSATANSAGILVAFASVNLQNVQGSGSNFPGQQVYVGYGSSTRRLLDCRTQTATQAHTNSQAGGPFIVPPGVPLVFYGTNANCTGQISYKVLS